MFISIMLKNMIRKLIEEYWKWTVVVLACTLAVSYTHLDVYKRQPVLFDLGLLRVSILFILPRCGFGHIQYCFVIYFFTFLGYNLKTFGYETGFGWLITSNSFYLNLYFLYNNDFFPQLLWINLFILNLMLSSKFKYYNFIILMINCHSILCIHLSRYRLLSSRSNYFRHVYGWNNFLW